MIRALFRVESIKSNRSPGQEVELSAVTDDKTPEGQKFAKYTPNGNMRMYIDNPAAQEQFTIGKKFYVDFNEVPEDAVAAGPG